MLSVKTSQEVSWFESRLGRCFCYSLPPSMVGRLECRDFLHENLSLWLELMKNNATLIRPSGLMDKACQIIPFLETEQVSWFESRLGQLEIHFSGPSAVFLM